jgi:two-component sensor histidine kinase
VNSIIQNRAEKHLFYLCIAATPLWIAWILFDYWFAPDQFYQFLPTRFLGSLMSIIIIFNHFKKWWGVFITQIFMFATYNAILAYYISKVPEIALPHYFNGYMMVMIVMYMVLIIRFIDILWFTLLTLSAFVWAVLFGNHEFIVVMGNGGFSFLTVVMLMILFALLKWRGILRDVSLAAEIAKARETAELNKTLALANQEKEILLQEIHHRVKNNLQLVSSMLNLQKAFVNDESIKAILQDSQQRVSSMSRIHETLYQSKNFSSINIAEYLKKLVHEIKELYPNGDKQSMELSLELEDIHININDAIPIGLIANEILTNVVKHAFPHGLDGRINISVKKAVDHIELIISDNGVGFDPNAIQNDTLGRELISTLIEQIDGTLHLSTHPGVTYHIRIPKKKPLQSMFEAPDDTQPKATSLLSPSQ